MKSEDKHSASGVTSRTVPSAIKGYITELDGFRAVGLTGVMMAHFWPLHNSMVFKFIRVGWALMDCFFVLSGFLIAGILLDSRDRPDYYRSYYTRRTLRIFPLYYALISLLLVYAYFGNSGSAYSEFIHHWGSPWWFFLYLGNFVVAFTGHWAPMHTFDPLWSLQIEEQFYLLLPLAIRHLRQETVARMAWGMVVLSPLLRIVIFLLHPNNRLAQYVLAPCHAEGLAFGILIAIRYRRGSWNINGRFLSFLTVLSVMVFGFSAALGGYDYEAPFNRTIGLSLSSLAAAAFVLWIIHYRGSSLTAWLRIRPLQYVGKISYGGYLLHVPVATATAMLLHHLHMGPSPRSVWPVPLYIILSLAVAAISWEVFESPILRLKDRVAPSSGTKRGRVPLTFNLARQKLEARISPRTPAE